MKKNKYRVDFIYAGTSTCCLITAENKNFLGYANCLDQDKDMQNRRTGEFISNTRAEIQYLCHLRDTVYAPKVKTLEDLLATINSSNKHDDGNFETKMIKRQLKFAREDLTNCRTLIAEKRENLRDYIKNKEKFYQKVRANRNKDKNN